MCPGELKADINETLEAFEHVLHLYRSGLHLDNLPPSVFTGNGSWDKRFAFLIPPFSVGLFSQLFSPRLCFDFVSREEEEDGGKKMKGGVFFSAPAVLTGLLGSWNERTRPTKWD